MEITAKEFAAQQGVSDSIIYRHIRNHKEALGDRVFKRGKATWLTEEGQAYIKELMTMQPLIIKDNSKEIEDLKEENKALLQALNAAKDKIIELTNQNASLSIQTAKIELLEAENAKSEERVQAAESRAQAAEQKVAEFENRNFWQRLFGK